MYFCILSEWLSWLKKQSQRNMLKVISATAVYSTFSFVQKETKCGLVTRTIFLWQLHVTSLWFMYICWHVYYTLNSTVIKHFIIKWLVSTVLWKPRCLEKTPIKQSFFYSGKNKNPEISSRKSIPFAVCKANIVNHKFLDELEDLSFPWYAPLLAAFPCSIAAFSL